MTQFTEERNKVRQVRDIQMKETELNSENHDKVMETMQKEIESLQKLENEQKRLREQHANLLRAFQYDETELYQRDLETIKLENGLQEDNEKQKRLSVDREKLERQFHEIKFAENEMINERNRFELSLNSLQELIRQAQEELEENQIILDREKDELIKIESQIEELNKQITEKENEIKRINRELESLNDEQKRLISSQNDLKKQQAELETVILQLTNVLKEKEVGLTHLQINMQKCRENIDGINQQLSTLR